MKKSLKPILIVIGLTILIGNVYSGPPPKKVKITVVNKCEWDVPFGLGRDVNMADGETKLTIVTMKSVPANGTIVFDDVEAGVPDFTFIVLNETTNRYIRLIPYEMPYGSTNDYNIYTHKLTFIHDSTITLFYSHYAMKYTMGYEEDSDLKF